MEMLFTLFLGLHVGLPISHTYKPLVDDKKSVPLEKITTLEGELHVYWGPSPSQTTPSKASPQISRNFLLQSWQL